MTDETPEPAEITFTLDTARAVMYSELTELTDEQAINQTLAQELITTLTELYDSRHEIAAEVETPTHSQTDN
jgi:hypothetical protein